MRYTTPITTLAVNSSGERQLEAHHLDDNFAAQDNAIQAITRALFAAGGVAKAGTVTLTGLNLRVQDRVGVTLDTSAALHVTDLTLDLTTLPAGKGTVVMTTDPVTVNRTYTDIVTQENLTDTMTVRLGRLYVMGAGTAGVALDAGGYPVAPQNTVPVAHVTRTAGGAVLDEMLNPAIQVNSSVTGPQGPAGPAGPAGEAGPAGAAGPAGEAGQSVTDAEIDSSGHLILTLSDATTIDAGEVSGGGGDSSLPAPGAAGHVLTSDGSTWISAAPAGDAGSGGDPVSLSAAPPPSTGFGLAWNDYSTGGSADMVLTALQTVHVNAIQLPHQATTADGSLMPPSTRVDLWNAAGTVQLATTTTTRTAQSNLGTLDAPQVFSPGTQFRVRVYGQQPLTPLPNGPQASSDGGVQFDSSPWNRPLAVNLLGVSSRGKDVVGPLDSTDVPKFTNAADVPNGGQGLLISTLPPRWVYRHTDGTPYYGPVYSATP